MKFEHAIKRPMPVNDLRADFCKLTSVFAPSPELLLYHAMLAVDRLERALREIERIRAADAWIFAGETLRAEGLEQ